jgi:hypothetical protein
VQIASRRFVIGRNWLYRKMKGKAHVNAKVFLNQEVIEDLTWLSSAVHNCIGVRFVDASTWHDSEAEMIMWTDASLRTGLSFVYSNLGFAYQLKECPSTIKSTFSSSNWSQFSALSIMPHPYLISHAAC